MTRTKLDIAFWDYDRTRALMDGSIAIDGVDATYHTARIVPEIFRAMIAERAYDVSELGMTYFLRALEVDPAFLAIPVFPNRAFRHSAIYVHADSGIERPEDLNGRTIGELALYGHDAGVMPKGMLMDEHGFDPASCKWIVGGIDFKMDPIDFVPQPHPDAVDVKWAAPDADLGVMLEAGEIDALISADIPHGVLNGSPKMRRLFVDYESAERDYYRRTGIFPIMHAVVVRRELAEQNPETVTAVYRGFCEAKQRTMDGFVKGMTFNNMNLMVPWLTKRIEADRSVLGEDWWPYGIKANRAAVDAILRYHHEQGLTKHRFAIEDIFVPYLLES